MEQDDKLGEMGGHNNNLTPGGAAGVNPEDLKALEGKIFLFCEFSIY